MKKRDILILCIALGAAVILGAVQFLGGAVETGSWGLSFRTPGQPPVGSEDAATLRRYDAYYVGDTSQKVLYLTFDAGYENGNTGKILDVLKKENVPAAFFLVGNYIEKNPDLVRRMAAEGHIVGNHTMHHPDMSIKKTEEKFAPELTGLEELYKNTVGDALPKFYRPPQGVYSKENLEMVRKLVDIDFAQVGEIEPYIEGEFVELEINIKERVLGCITRFCSQKGIRVSEILEDRSILKELIRELKIKYQIKYTKIMDIMNIPRGVMEKLKD